MGEVKILARGNLPLPPARSAVLLSQLLVSLLSAFGEGSRQLWRAQFVRSSWIPLRPNHSTGSGPCQALISVRTRASSCGVGLLPRLLPSTTCDPAATAPVWSKRDQPALAPAPPTTILFLNMWVVMASIGRYPPFEGLSWH
jgi:hypothetical protein